MPVIRTPKSDMGHGTDMSAVLDNMADAFFLLDREYHFLYLNHKAEDFLGSGKEQVVGHLIWDFFPDDRNSKLSQILIRAFSEKDKVSDHFFSTIHFRWYRITGYSSDKGIAILLSDIHEEKLAELDLLESRQLIYQIAESTPDILTVFNINTQRYEYVNKQVFSLLGYKPEDLRRMSRNSILNRIHPSDVNEFREYHEERFLNAKDDEILESCYRILNANSFWRWLLIRGKVFKRDKNGKVSHFIAITQDITEKKEVEERQQGNQLLQTTIEKKEEFVSVSSHELKTPITAIKASIQIIKRQLENQVDEKSLLVFVGKAYQQVDKLIDLINDVFETAKVYTGKMHLNMRTFSIDELITDAKSLLPENQRIIVRSNYTGLLTADKNKIEQVIVNYLTNAVKYSPPGKEVFLDVNVEGRFLKFSVTDFGIGIPEDKIDKVFDRFFRIGDQTAQSTGLGLGLYISAEIIKRHFGVYGVKSEEGQGSTFWFKIPYQRPR
ncbi:PAS domain-containing sensor histidine kinase [Rubrolithibacter danxiaensis]|uniref:sensor histidine kinase n=1 Tax=Rubrolithibacter danxiaensis TaxID=3390805 RepID=UPI003BF7CE44